MKKILSLTPLSERTKKEAYIPKSSFIRALSVISPQLVYYYINQIVTYEGALLVGRVGEVSAISPDRSQLIAALIRILAVTLGTLPLLYSFTKEYPIALPDPKDRRHDYGLLYSALLSASLALFLNVIASYSGFAEISKSFEKTSSGQFSFPIWVGIVIYGIITPVTEEIVHRGLIYNRLRRYFGLPIAVVVSSLLFGVSHGNLVQLLYGSVMGIFICCIYERYGAFLYPVLFHCAANTTVYIVIRLQPLRDLFFTWPAVTAECALSLLLIYRLFKADKDVTS